MAALDSVCIGWNARKRFPSLRMLAVLLGALAVFFSAVTGGAEAKPQFSAISIDARNGKVLFAVDPDGLRHPASLTKVMTLYLLFEDLKSGKVKLTTPLRVSSRSAAMAPSKLGLKPGSTITVDDAIRALVTKSANDIAATIGENLGGTESAFALRMTNTARALGMTKTVFKNASGLPNPAQVTTARDMATLSLRIQRDFPQYYPYFRITSFTYDGRTIRTHNRLLGKYAGADGIKTGYIADSGFNLTSSAKRGQKRVVGVVLGARSGNARNAYMMAMLDKAFPKCSNGSTIAALAGSSKGAIDPVAELNKTAQQKASANVAALAATVESTTVTPAETAAAGDQPIAEDEDAAELSDESNGATFKKIVKAEKPARPEVIEASLGAEKLPAKLPFAVKEEAKPSDVGQLVASITDPTWKVQVGAYVKKKDAQAYLQNLKKTQSALLKDKLAFTVEVQKGTKTTYRARFSGFTEDDAKALCGKLEAQKLSCLPLPPQS